MVKRNQHRDKRERRPPNLSVKLACCLVELGLVDREDAKRLTADQILSLVQFDHIVLHAHGDVDPTSFTFAGVDHPTNFTPRLILDHRDKTAKTDTPAVAKTDRLQPKEIEFRRRLLAKAGQHEAGCRAVQAGPHTAPCSCGERKHSVWPKGQKIKSRGFQKRSASKTKADNA